MLPYGEQRGTTTGVWAAGMDKGFVGGTQDPTGLSPFTFLDPSGLVFFEGTHGNGQIAYPKPKPSGGKPSGGKPSKSGAGKKNVGSNYHFRGKPLFDSIGNSRLMVEPDVTNPLTVDELVNQKECKQNEGPRQTTCTLYSELPEYKKKGYVKETLCYNNPKQCREWQAQENGVIFVACLEASGQMLILGAGISLCGGVDGEGAGVFAQLKSPRAGSIDAGPEARVVQGSANVAVGIMSGTIRGMDGQCAPGLYGQAPVGGPLLFGGEVDAGAGWQAALLKGGAGTPTGGAQVVCNRVIWTSY